MRSCRRFGEQFCRRKGAGTGYWMILTQTYLRSRVPLLLMVFCWLGGTVEAQQPPPGGVSTTHPMAQPSAVMQPSLNAVGEALGVLRPEKWKAPSSVRQEAAANIESIRRDLEVTLPPLLAAADEDPSSLAHALPAYRNIEALYDVLLRVTEAGRLSAPRDQAVTLQRALAGLEGGRRAFAEQMQSAAVAHDQQLRSLEAAARAAPRTVVATPAPCPPAPHTKKRRTTSKTVRKPMHPSTSKTTGTASH